MNADIRRSSGTSLHRQLFLLLREMILRGDFLPGASFLTEDELIDEFKVSRNTVRRAVTDLESQGLVEKYQGRGTFVSSDLPLPRKSATLSYLEVIRQTTVPTKVELLHAETIAPSRAIGKQLGLASGEQAFHTLRLRRSGKIPVTLSESWIDARYAALLKKSDLRQKAMHEMLIENGVSLGRVVQEVNAVLTNPMAAKYLDTEIGSPMTKLTRLLYDTKRKPVQHLTVYFSPGKSRLLMEVAFGSIDTFESGHVFHDIVTPEIAYEDSE